jgi:hypothetical protein
LETGHKKGDIGQGLEPVAIDPKRIWVLLDMFPLSAFTRRSAHERNESGEEEIALDLRPARKDGRESLSP